MAETTPKKKEPTASEAMFFFAIVKHTKNKADIDWDAVATEQGFKNAEVAKVRFGQVKRKLGISATESPAASKGTPGKKAPGTPTRVTKASGRSGAKGKARGGRVKKEEIPENEASLDGDDDETVMGVPMKMEPMEPEEERDPF